MESPIIESKSSSNEPESQRSASTSSSNQLFIPNTELPDDTFRMSLDNYSFVGENVTVGERTPSVCINSNASTPPVKSLPTPNTMIPDNSSVAGDYIAVCARDQSRSVDSNASTLVLSLPTPNTMPPDTPSSFEPFSPISAAPTLENPSTSDSESRKSPESLQPSCIKNNENGDMFVRPSPMADAIMSPAKMLQFEVTSLTCSTPTMKRAAVDFDFFTKNNFEEYFKDIPTIPEEDEAPAGKEDKKPEETSVIVKPDTVRHEIGFALEDLEYLMRTTSIPSKL
ncbi:hypothetical protein NE865_13844 [Phthorimaea operculella]|nr:hypothetical protein NE865_13844 [Phthorimaea operculella]